MENLKKRWTVTYTKHIKQKRKVYQDGFLDLHLSTNKVMLFDECEKLLECRILKGEEVVSAGEALTFNGYFVDVGELEGEVDQKPIPDLKLRGKERKILERPRPSLMHRHKFTSPSISSEDDKDTAEKSKARLNNLSPSQKIIREFKKSELQRYGALRSCPESPDTLNAHVTEWQVMYTTQLTQKAKKYHDGFLRLTKSGSLGRQIMLYDASRKLLDSRFLKKDEIIRSHESVVFDAHLVDIGEPEQENQLPMDLNVQGNNISLIGKERVMHEHQNCLDHKSPAKEWHALYTSQITQKAKKYHSGILRLACDAYKMRVTLLNEDKAILSTKLVSLSEEVRRGSTFGLPKYLVEVGDPYTPKEATNSACSRKDAGSNFNISSIGKFQSNACPREDVDSRSIFAVEGSKISNIAPTDKSLRDIHQILSILQKPLAQKSVVVGCTDNNMTASVFSAKEIHISDSEVDCPKDCQLPIISLPKDGPSKNKDNEGSSKFTDIEKYTSLMPSKVISIPSGGQLANDSVTGNSDQSHLDNTKADTKRCDEAFASGFSSGCTSYVPTDDEKKSNEQLKSTRETDEWPTFDLGF
ncbi:uncharacterized protein LOC110658664 isoform X2 [Hevea brasiliensis]|uniref:uncharacterized protein LOC110658664 isoform X2 n=1 Tax=Hevea brasiliensis TaxID=3981 RepID=UPI0025D1E181|nr:uncharacterized protein LOC110658664 isoform X2 [Hevea brasiliensis]